MIDDIEEKSPNMSIYKSLHAINFFMFFTSVIDALYYMYMCILYVWNHQVKRYFLRLKKLPHGLKLDAKWTSLCRLYEFPLSL